MAENGFENSPKSPENNAAATSNPQNKKLLIIIAALSTLVVGLLIAVCILALGGKDSDGGQNSNISGDGATNNEPTVSVIDGFVAVNGKKTKYEVKKDDVIEVVDGFLVVNGVKTEYEVELSCNHEWQTETTAPTCTENGYDIKTCSVCEKRIKTNETPAKSHNFGSYVTNDEYHWMKCTACGEEKDKAEHSPNNDGECETCGIPLSDTPGIVYDVSADGTYAEVVDYTGIATKVKIASEYNGVPVKTIYDGAFSRKNITSVIIPDSVTSIGYGAFSGCTSLSSVEIGDSVTSIGSSAFSGCSSLSSVVIPDSVTSIGSSAFSGCSSLSSVVIPDSVTSIGSSAFYGCKKLSSVVIGDSVTSIGESAFNGCTSLSSVVIPDSVTSIGGSAFYGCHSSLYTEYEYGKYVRSGDNPYAVLIGTTNYNMSTYTINENTKHIAYYAFWGCSRLTSITIPDSVTSIGDEAFEECTSLSSVVIGDSVTSIGSYAFYGCKKLSSIVIPDSVTSIGSYAFSGCTSLTDVYITDIAAWCKISFSDFDSNPMYYGANLYLNGELITELVIPDSVTSIGSYAFYNCKSLSSIVIGDSVTSIGKWAFSSCTSLRDVYYIGSAEEWAEISIGSSNHNLTSATKHYNYIPE